jgi:general secretion pathway protein G
MKPVLTSGEGGARGFTLLEMIIAVAIVATLAALAVPAVNRHLHRTLLLRAIVDIRKIEQQLATHQIQGGTLPATLAEIGCDRYRDPWGQPYHYLRIATARRGEMRKDRFLVPINSDYDLYSVGQDGRSRPPLMARDSADDIVRANDGAFVGLAAEF